MTKPNPFRKTDFASPREWEEALMLFLLEQLRMPDAASWQGFSVDEEACIPAAFLSHQLANIALVRRMPSEAPLRRIFPMLMGHDAGLEDLRAWFARKWIDQSRLHGTLDLALRANVSSASHALMER